MSLLETLPKPFFVLAPMDDVTDSVFRQIVADCAAPDLYFTEFVNVDGLQSPGRPKLLKKLQITDKEKPIIAQLWGLKPENFYKTAKEIADMGFQGIDLNMGCPVKTVIKHGACAALINNKSLAEEIIDATKEGAGWSKSWPTQSGIAQGECAELNKSYGEVRRVSNVSSQRSDMPESSGRVAGSAGKQAGAVRGPGPLPVSVKTRVGFNNTDMDWIEFLLSKILNMLSIHGRTAKQLSKVPADWDLIGEVRKMRDVLCPSTLIVGNGDVRDHAHGLALAKKYQLDGVMIGRGIFNDPFAFAQASPWTEYGREQKLALYRKHIELFIKTWQNREYRFEALRKFCKVYISDFEGAHELRARFMETETPEEALALLS